MTRGILAFANGECFSGKLITSNPEATGEVVFNTAMTGYQEMITDPSYKGQILCLTNPHIGNTGVNSFDAESSGLHLSALVIRRAPSFVQHHRSQGELTNYLLEHNVPLLYDIDTREITHFVREHGATPALITSAEISQSELKSRLSALKGTSGLDLASSVSTRSSYKFDEAPWQQTAKPTFAKVAVIDFGVKRSILRQLRAAGLDVTVLPASTHVTTSLISDYDAFVLSNGPGDPDAVAGADLLVSKLLTSGKPLLGICLGFQILALALGAKSYKMTFGHHGGNQPVFDVVRNRVMITSQNHSYAIDEKTLPNDLLVTQRSLFDNSLQGFKHKTLPVMGVQGHPEAGPGPADMTNVFDDFSAQVLASVKERACQKEQI